MYSFIICHQTRFSVAFMWYNIIAISFHLYKYFTFLVLSLCVLMCSNQSLLLDVELQRVCSCDVILAYDLSYIFYVYVKVIRRQDRIGA